MSAFKKHHSLFPRTFRRSLSEQDAGAAALKDYHWYHRMKSKKLNKQMSFDSEKPLGAYRRQTHPWPLWRVSSREGSSRLKGECGDPSLARSSARVGAASADNLLQVPAEAAFPTGTGRLRAAFSRSLSEPAARPGSGNARPSLHAVRSLHAQHQGYLLRGAFASLSSGFSKIMSRKGHPVSESVAEGKTEDNRFVLSADVKGPPTHRLSCGQSPYTEMTTWERKYCILTDSQLVLLNREKEVRQAHCCLSICPLAFIGERRRQVSSSPLYFAHRSFETCARGKREFKRNFCTAGVMRHWSSLPREVVGAPSL
uniref:Uncharacterized protein n=1 Tax=Ficedula albicollis TaxID=59894 RepID=A0A803WA94_FICAL